MPFKAARPAGRRRGSCDDSPAPGSRILEEASTRLAAQAAGIDHLAQQRRRPVLGIAEAVVQHFHDGQHHIQADQVSQRQRSDGMVAAQLH